MQLNDSTAPAPGPGYSGQHPLGRHAELRAALLRTLRLGRRPTTIERAEIDRAIRLQMLAEQAASDPGASVDVRLRAEHFSDVALRRLLRGRLAVLEGSRGS